MKPQDVDVVRLFLLREAARNASSRVCLTNNCLKKLLGRERIWYSTLSRFAKSMCPLFEGHKKGLEIYGVKTTLILSVEKGKGNQGKTHTITSVPPISEMKRQLGID